MKVVVTSTITPQLITLSCLLAYTVMYGNHHTMNSAHECFRPPRIFQQGHKKVVQPT